MALRELIKDAHDSAENHPFVKKLFAGQITKEEYGDFLFNQKHCYAALEQTAEVLGLLDDIGPIKRTAKIAQDLRDLHRDKSRQHLHMSTMNYCEYVKTCTKEQLLAHLYVRHFGDMYGGQMLKKLVPGNGTMYEFYNRAELIATVREKLTDDLADEAKIVFAFATQLFDELADEYNIQ
jgi:heme oxygenase